MNVRAVERQFLEEGLRCALERREFALHYQPIVNISTGEISGAEALIRWTHPVLGQVSPAQFIPLAEDCGLILPIGNWVLHEACKQASAWINAGLHLRRIAVNISAMQFRKEQFLENVFAILKQTGLDPRALELELTETVLIRRAESAAVVLQTLRASGIQIAVDDFGTGYSSLSYLTKFPLDVLKIDQSFVRQITVAPEDTSIVTAVISDAWSLKASRTSRSWHFFKTITVRRRKDIISAVRCLRRSSPDCSKPAYEKSSRLNLKLFPQLPDRYLFSPSNNSS
jgi:EAL domain-containing protein (putative c-di-GMP-specific phosphodiesterase class I)